MQQDVSCLAKPFESAGSSVHVVAEPQDAWEISSRRVESLSRSGVGSEGFSIGGAIVLVCGGM